MTSLGLFLPRPAGVFLRGDGKATLMELLPAPWVSPAEQIRWVRELRRLAVADLIGMPGAKISIGGIPALNADYENAVGDRLPRVIALVVTATFLALFAGFRSLFAAAKAVALNLLSVGAAFGALVLVFQEGHGSRFLGVHEGTAGVFPIVPILAFAIVFGLSMDYEVFLVARVLEARQERPERNRGHHGSSGKNSGSDHQCGCDHDCSVRGLHSGRLPGDQDARLYPGSRCID